LAADFASRYAKQPRLIDLADRPRIEIIGALELALLNM
jgi:hypothetical protein